MIYQYVIEKDKSKNINTNNEIYMLIDIYDDKVIDISEKLDLYIRNSNQLILKCKYDLVKKYWYDSLYNKLQFKLYNT